MSSGAELCKGCIYIFFLQDAGGRGSESRRGLRSSAALSPLRDALLRFDKTRSFEKDKSRVQWYSEGETEFVWGTGGGVHTVSLISSSSFVPLCEHIVLFVSGRSERGSGCLAFECVCSRTIGVGRDTSRGHGVGSPLGRSRQPERIKPLICMLTAVDRTSATTTALSGLHPVRLALGARVLPRELQFTSNLLLQAAELHQEAQQGGTTY
ncbi:unnamed protein product [Pleuronectes platessa]|uniref:Uncharacterized protein n=1 Tax=Pleuronectes platessa TaxID=8262 RepID=A0A9N7Y974_PLEPL|nr:unnamed protein product [Pleuronectes platessa]